jgi:DNA-binding ferritin-like protein
VAEVNEYADIAIFQSTKGDGSVVGKRRGMADTVDKVAERLAHLEVTVAQGFHDAELRDINLSRKVDVVSESLRSDIRTVAEAVTTLGNEMRRTTDAIRQEHAADRAVLTTAIGSRAAGGDNG